MKIDEFESQIADELANFFRNYRDEHELDPEQWPLEMSGGEWFEQLLAALN